MASISDLSYTNNMAAAKKPLLTDLEETLDSIQTYINTSLTANIEQFVLDAFPSGYAFDDDGAKNYTGFDLFDKQTISDTDTGGDVTISTTGAWTDVDATNAAIVFTPVLLAGDFRVTFQFNVESVTSNATNETDVRFRLTDSSTASDALARVKLITGVTTTTNTVPVHLSYVYDSLAASSQTVKLQYYITTSTATTIKVLANSNDPICMKVEKV
jgi:hypothetical protein